MKKAVWRKHHKWFGLILGFFIIMFCVSGLVLNHAELFSNINISRSVLPSDYRYTQWNGGLLRGTMRWQKQVLIYGNSGIWLTDSTASSVTDFNQGLPHGADFRQIRGMVTTPAGEVFALGQYGLYHLQPNRQWSETALPREEDEKLSDITTQGDSLIVTGRSHIFLARPPYTNFARISLTKAANDDGKVSLFRTIWLLHSGELFGIVGVLLVDSIAIVLIFLTLTGVVYWFLPHLGKGRGRLLRRKLSAWHNHIGKLTIALTLFLCITGWMLRPPALIALASGKIPPIPFTTMDSNNPWHEKLRTLRYDADEQEWLLYSSEGFFSLKDLQSQPQAVTAQPPVSVMGINAQEKDEHGQWLIGSFYGMFCWNRKQGTVTDYFTGRPAEPIRGIPVGKNAVAGFTSHFGKSPIVVDYYRGTPALPMPSRMASLPMSLRNVCIEIHTGRIYTFLGKGTLLYIFLIGLALAWCLWSGWKIRYNNHRTKH